jgi:diacylglycerol kinase family enzyme
LPSGTGNLLARNLDVPLDFSDAMAVALHGSHRRIDLGRVDAQPFAVMAGIGFDAAMMADASEGLKQRAGWAAYVISGLRHLRDPVMRVHLRIDGEPPLRRQARTVLVGNVGRLQAGLELLPDAEADDGLLDVVVVAPRTIPDWVRLVWRLFRRDRSPHPHLERFRGREIAIAADRIAPRQIDGEVIGGGRSLHARIEPGVLVVCVPQAAATAA